MTDGQTEWQSERWAREKESQSRIAEGGRAFWQKLSISDCPYPEGSLDEACWLWGWEAASREKGCHWNPNRA